jgi:hypothetical protein
MLIGQTDGGRVLTLVIERTLDSTTWLIVTGWPATDRERKSSIEMANDPWKDPDPQPGDFDAELDQAQIKLHEGNPEAKLSILVSVEGDDAKRLERIANERGQQPGEVVSQLLRSA